MGASSAVDGEPPELSKIAIPKAGLTDTTKGSVQESAISPERRKAVLERLEKAFTEAKNVLIASLEPNSLFLMKEYQQEKAGKLHKNLLDGHKYYGSLALDKITIP